MMKNKKVIVGTFLSTMLIFGVLVAGDVCFAAITAPTGTGLPTGTIGGSIEKIIKFLLAFIGGLSVLMIIVSGIMYITSTGESSKTETAKNMLTYSIVGLVVSLLAWIIVDSVIGAIYK